MNRPKHHIRQSICGTRTPYREGRKPTAVKVYTVHHESRYVLVQGVPAVGASQELVRLFEAQGEIDDHKILDNYPAEHFTETHFIKYKRIQSARYAKKKLDDWSFYGGVLHVCYVPEYETIQETREKLQERQRAIAYRTKKYEKDGTYDLYQLSSGATTQESMSAGTHQENNSLYWQQPGSAATQESMSAGNHQENSSLYGQQPGSASGDSDRIPVYNDSHSSDTPDYQALRSAQHENFQSYDSCYQNTNNTDVSANVQNRHEPISHRDFYGGPVPNSMDRNVHFIGMTLSSASAKQVTSIHNKKPKSQAVQQAQAMQIYGTFENKSKVPTASEVSSKGVTEHVKSAADLPADGSQNPSGVRSDLETDHSVSDNFDTRFTASSSKRPHPSTTSDIIASSADDQSLSASHKVLSESSDSVTSNEQLKILSDEVLVLPPPPKQRKTTFKANNQYRYTLAKVPSAHAVFPAGFDARLSQPSSSVKPENVQNSDKAQRVTHETIEVSDKAVPLARILSKPAASIGSKSNTSDKQRDKNAEQYSSLSIDYSKTNHDTEHNVSLKKPMSTSPRCSSSEPVGGNVGDKPNISVRFIPRQTLKKQASTDGEPASKGDHLSAALKKNAFILKDVQGPVDVVENRKNQTPTEISVNKTVLEIRKKVTNVTKVPTTKK